MSAALFGQAGRMGGTQMLGFLARGAERLAMRDTAERCREIV
jgi:hypothetical protein